MGGASEGRHAFVTGGSRGIGRAIASALTGAGARVTVMARDAKALGTVIEAREARFGVAGDVTDAQSLRRAVDEAQGQGGPIDILVANAGGVETAPFRRTGADVFRRMIDLNVIGTVNALQAVLPGMTERGFGRLVAVSSTAGLKGYAYVSAYCAAKHAVIGLVRSLALETAKTGVTINAVCPGFTETDLVRESFSATAEKTGKSYEDILGEVLKDKPLGRLVQPREVAEAVLFLCGEGASAVTGQALAVAGGEV